MVLLDNRITKASFRNCSIKDRERFHGSHCLFPVSMGQSSQMGIKLEATLKLINSSFSKCTILLGDTLQRHNLKAAFGLNDQLALSKSIELGNDWIKQNQPIILNSHNTANINLMRWNEWLNHPEFTKRLSLIDDAYLSSASFREALDLSVKEYLGRQNIFDTDKKKEHACLHYLKEECAVMTLWPKEGYDFELYPTGRNAAMQATYETFIKTFYSNLLVPVALRFKKYPCYPAANFCSLPSFNLQAAA